MGSIWQKQCDNWQEVDKLMENYAIIASLTGIGFKNRNFGGGPGPRGPKKIFWLLWPRVPHNLRLTKGTLLGRNPLTKVELYLRVFGRDAIRMGMILLGSLAGKYFKAMAADGKKELKSRKRLIQKNVELQSELVRFFASYHYLCPACDGCCHYAQIPYCQLDRILYGIPDEPGIEISPSFLQELGGLLHTYLTIPLKRVRIGNSEAGQPELFQQNRVSECLGINGCTIPLGKRPVHCVLFACGLFLKNMDRAAYWRYLRLSLKYLFHLTASLMAMVAEWRQQTARTRHCPAGADAARTETPAQAHLLVNQRS
jgi:hypothetical protein